MTIDISMRNAKGALIAAVALLGGSFAVCAPAVAEPVAGLSVVAPHVMDKQVASLFGGPPAEFVTLTQEVGYGDLDLTSQSGVQAFETRILEAAKDTCARLDRADRLDAPAGEDCVETASGDAMAQAKVIIADVQKLAAASARAQTFADATR